jgi:hypothetical protein
MPTLAKVSVTKQYRSSFVTSKPPKKMTTGFGPSPAAPWISRPGSGPSGESTSIRSSGRSPCSTAALNASSIAL